MRYTFILITATLFFIGCANKKSVAPEGEKPADSLKQKNTETIQVPDVESNIQSVDNQTDLKNGTNNSHHGINNEQGNTIIPAEIEPAEKNDIAKEELPEIEEIPEESPPKMYTAKFDPEILYPDSVWTEYLTHPGDYLSLIAYHEYNNPNEWRRIWQWNKPHWKKRNIGPNPDNPNFIYPYRELDLKKPTNEALEWEYDFEVHTVKPGESLWTIAKDTYDDEYSWVILFWDNESLINENNGKLYPGMELKIRSSLWPDVN